MTEAQAMRELLRLAAEQLRDYNPADALARRIYRFIHDDAEIHDDEDDED